MTSSNVYFSAGIDYEKMTDEKLINLIKNNDNKALNCLINRYKETVEIKATKYYLSVSTTHIRHAPISLMPFK